MTKKSSFSTTDGTFLDKLLQAWRASKIKKYLGKNAFICDFGCGYEAVFLRKNKKFFSKSLGLDIEVNSLFSNQSIELKEADLNSVVPVSNDLVDVVTSLAVIEHIENYQKYLQEAFRILKKEGKFILTTPDPKGEIVLDWLARLRLINKDEINDHKRYFKKEDLIADLKKAGFSEVVLKKFQFGFNNLFIAKK